MDLEHIERELQKIIWHGWQHFTRTLEEKARLDTDDVAGKELAADIIAEMSY